MSTQIIALSINLRMNNQDPIVAFHLEFQMPEALKYYVPKTTSSSTSKTSKSSKTTKTTKKV